jgi:hypothetical protein
MFEAQKKRLVNLKCRTFLGHSTALKQGWQSPIGLKLFDCAWTHSRFSNK